MQEVCFGKTRETEAFGFCPDDSGLGEDQKWETDMNLRQLTTNRTSPG